MFEDSDSERWICHNAVGEADATKLIFNAIHKVGFCPFTHECLKNPSIIHELVVSVQGDACDDANPAASYYTDPDKQNHHTCSLFKAFGYTGADLLRKSLQRVLAEKVALWPATREAIQNQLMTAITAGKKKQWSTWHARNE
jgi:hypothetical protein